MRISQLRCFVTVAQLENMSQAAELLHLSQSSLSKNIATLEEELGTQLFQRKGRSLTLNPAGERLLEYSTMALRELEYAKEDLQLLSQDTESRIRIGMAGFHDSLTECLCAFRNEMPHAEFELISTIENQEYLDINEFDMLIYPDTHKYEKFTGMKLYEEKYYLAVHTRHTLAKNTFVRTDMLEGLDVVFLRNGRSGEEFPFRICGSAALKFSSVSYADNRELHRHMIAGGLCAGFVPQSCSSFYKDSKIRLIPIQDKRFSRQMMICFRKEKHLSPLAMKFRDFLIGYYSLHEGS